MINLTFPVLNAIDGWLAHWVPVMLRVALWGVASGVAALGLYAALSDQPGLARLKRATRGLRREMLDPDLDRDAYMRLVRQNLAQSFRLLGKSLVPSMLSSVPVLVIVLWLSVYYSYDRPPPGEAVPVDVVPAQADVLPASIPPLQRTADGTRLMVGDAPQPVRFVDAAGTVYQGTPDDPPTPVVQKRTWWNALLGNQAGYIRADAAADEIRFQFPFKHLLSGVPEWMATWELTYFLSLVVAALICKFGLKIE
ncbi:MAG: hypothetical protein U1E66_10335 [Rhodospirillales bacterium]